MAFHEVEVYIKLKRAQTETAVLAPFQGKEERSYSYCVLIVGQLQQLFLTRYLSIIVCGGVLIDCKIKMYFLLNNSIIYSTTKHEQLELPVECVFRDSPIGQQIEMTSLQPVHNQNLLDQFQ